MALLSAGAIVAGCAAPFPKQAPPPAAYETGRPPIYERAGIRRIAVLTFGDRAFTDYMAELLVHHSRWHVMDRASLDRIIREQQLQQSHLFDPATAARLGKLAGVDLVVLGEYHAGSEPARDEHAARVIVKAIDVETAEFLAYKNIEIPPRWTALKDRALYACQALLPYRIKKEGGKPTYIWVGPTADEMTD